jgi:8-oxo-dGTP pyrophosphatase MutT (NUDIX family)
MSGVGRVEIVLVVVQCDGRICLVRRSERVATSRGLWSVVTGYVEPGVDPLEQATRELDEELGLRSPDVVLLRRLEPLPLTSAASGKRFLVHPFLFESGPERHVVLNWEHTELAWAEPVRLADSDCVAWQHEIVQALLGPRGSR